MTELLYEIVSTLYLCVSIASIVLLLVLYLHDTRNIIRPISMLVLVNFLVYLIPGLRMAEEIEFLNLQFGVLALQITFISAFLFLTLIQAITGRLLSFGPQKWMNQTRNPQQQKTSLFFFLSLIGFSSYLLTIHLSGGLRAYYSAAHLSGLNHNISAYVYNLQYLILPAALALLVSIKNRGVRSIRYWCYFLVAFSLIDAYLMGRRGIYIRVALVLFSAQYIFLHQATHSGLFKRVFILPLLGLVFVSTLYLTPVIRQFSSLGNDFNVDEVMYILAHRDIFVGSVDDHGSEIIYGSAVAIGTHNVGPTLGLKWTFPFLSFVPREFWPSKPTYTEFVFPFHAIAREHGGVNPSNGAAVTGLADAYTQFGILAGFIVALVFFFIDRYYLKLIRAGTADSAYWFSSITVGVVYFLLQDFSQGMLSFLFAILPYLAFRKLGFGIGRPA